MGGALLDSIKANRVESLKLTLIIKVNHKELELPKELLDPNGRTYCISKTGKKAISNALMLLHQNLKANLYDSNHVISINCLQIWSLTDRVQSTLDLLDKRGSLMKRIFYM